MTKSCFALSYLLLILLVPLCARADAWNLAFLGGISSPTPGIAAHVEGCYVIYARGCAGFSYTSSHNERTDIHAEQQNQHLMGLFEHRFPFRDEYHLFFAQLNAGAAHVARRYDKDAAPSEANVSKWGASLGGGLGMELPLADLMGFRMAVLARHPSVSGSGTQVATMAGIRFGVEWLGFGE